MPFVQAQMSPTYQKAFEDRGAGSHARRCALIQQNAERYSKTMFHEGTRQVTSHLSSLRHEVTRILRKECVERLMSRFDLTYSVLWKEVPPDVQRLRASMEEPIRTVILETQTALRHLLGEDDPRQDDEVCDVTAMVKAAQKPPEILDIDDFPDDAPPIKVKVELV